MATETVPEESKLVAVLADADAPLSQRMRAVFYLRGIGGAVAVDSLGRGAYLRRSCHAVALLPWARE